jgi:hypothetical protein
MAKAPIIPALSQNCVLANSAYHGDAKMQTANPPQTIPLSASSHLLKGNRVRYIRYARQVGLGAALQLLLENLGCRLYICRDAFRSFRGHIRTQLAKGQVGFRLGPHGHREAMNARTLCRTLYIQKLLATHPWADSQDIELFLIGFDAGDTWYECSRGILPKELIPESSSCWITPEIRCEINNTLDMLKRQWYKSQYESPRRYSASQSD